MTDAVQEYERRLIDAAHRYAASEASDPFALGRALCHIRQGICRSRNEASEEYGLAMGQDARYDAKSVGYNKVRP